MNNSTVTGFPTSCWDMAAILQDLFTSEGLDIFKAEVVRLLASQPRLRRPDLAKANLRLKEVQRELANLLTAIKPGVLIPSTKAKLEQLEAEQAGLKQTVAGRDKLFTKTIEFLPTIEQRFKALIDDLATVTQQQVDQARSLLRQLVGGQITLHRASARADHWLTAEMSGDYSGLMTLACGPQILSKPVERFYETNHGDVGGDGGSKCSRLTLRSN
jgi:chromosome condensin MukBEF ATPase and DNA-binding subunit MukB